jgi:hypothetical protein
LFRQHLPWQLCRRGPLVKRAKHSETRRGVHADGRVMFAHRAAIHPQQPERTLAA